jgi:putative ABC transport system permease protein
MMFRTSLRNLLKSAGFSSVVIAVLALGIGANTALFSIIDKVLLHPFPFRHLERMVEITGLTASGKKTGTAPIEMDFFAAHVHALEQSAVWRWQSLVLTGVDSADSIFALEVSQNLFDMLGVPPAHGRTLIARDFNTSAPPVAVISDRLWRKHFRAGPNIVGRQILLDGKGYTVVGVMGPGFVFTNPAHQVWIPLRPGLIAAEEMKHYFGTMALLRPGVSMQQAQKEIEAVTPGLPRNPAREDGWHAELRPFTEQFTGESGRALLILWCAVGLVLLIACANAANLILARAAGRNREFAIRASLGADRFQLMRQVFSETLLLGAVAGAVGIALAFGLLRLLVNMFPEHAPFPQLDRVSINPLALTVTVSLVLLVTLLCAIPACAGLRRSDLTEGLSATSRTASSNRGANRMRAAMVAFEVALSSMLLVGAGLMLHTMERLLQVHLGFEPQHVLTAQVSVPAHLKKAEHAAHYTRILDEVRPLPGILDAGIVTVLPFGSLVATTSFTAEGSTTMTPHDSDHAVYFREISPGYFTALGMRMLRGRDFTEGDGAGSPSVVIVSDELARRYWPGEDPIGRRLSRSDHPKPSDWSTIVGVVESVKHRSLRKASDSELYLPYTQQLMGAKYTYLVTRVKGDPLSVASAIRRRIHDIEPDQPVAEMKTLQTLVVDSAAEVRFHTLLLEIFAGLALGLAITGIFAVVSYSVSQRTREIGIRGALGATPRDTVRFVLAMAMRPVFLGACAGIACGLAATRVLQSELFETQAADPATFAIVFVLLIATAVAAAAFPAWRATRVDPAEVLRAE